MPKLDFSQQATPASTLDFSGGAEPVENSSAVVPSRPSFLDALGGDLGKVSKKTGQRESNLDLALGLAQASDPLNPVRDAASSAFSRLIQANPNADPNGLAQQAFNEVARTASPEQLKDPAFGQAIANSISRSIGGDVPMSAVVAPPALPGYREAGPAAAAGAFMQGFAKPLAQTAAVPVGLAGGVAGLGGSGNDTQNALFDAYTSMNSDRGEADIARSPTAGGLGTLLGYMAGVGLTPTVAGAEALPLVTKLAQGGTKSRVLAGAIEHALTNLPGALAAGGAPQGSAAAQKTLAEGGTLPQAFGEAAAGSTLGTAQFLAPVSLPGNLAVRTASGVAMQQALNQTQQQAQHAIAPNIFQPAQPFDPSDPMSYIGGIMGAIMGRRAPVEAFRDPHIDAVAEAARASAADRVSPVRDGAPLALPRGADFSAKAEPVAPSFFDAVLSKVAPQYAKWRPTLDPDAIAAAAAMRAEMNAGPATPDIAALPSPEPSPPRSPTGRAAVGGTVRVDAAGTAATPAQGRNAFAQAVASRMQSTAPGLPEPVVTVDRAGNAATSADQNAELSQIQQAIARQQQAAAERQALGLTPDVERAQAARFSEQKPAVDEMAVPADDFADVPFSRKPASFDFSNPGGAGKDGQHAREVKVGDTTITYGVGRTGVVSVDHVATPPAKRGQGSARAAMQALVEQADREGLRVALTPEPMSKGVSKAGLEEFYRSLGFQSNKGRSIDFDTRHSMIRLPKDDAAFSLAGERPHESVHANNASGESAASLEAINRQRDEQAQGRTRALIDRYGNVEPLAGADAVDAKARDGQVIVQRGIGREPWTVLDHGGDISSTVAQGKVNRARSELDALVGRATSAPAEAVAFRPRAPNPGRPVADGRGAAAEPRFADAQDTQAIAKYNAVLSRYIGSSVRFTPAAHVPEPDARALAEADEVFGGRSILVDNATPEALDLNGVTLRDGTRLINSDATSPAVHVAFHEISHQMKADAPDLFAELEAEMDRQGALDKYQRALSERAARNGENPARISDDLSREELISDAIGDAMADPVFLEHLAQRNPGLFQRLGDYIMASLKALTRKLRDLGSREFLSDVEAFRTKLADVLERYAQRKHGERAGGNDPNDPAFQRVFHGTTHTVDKFSLQKIGTGEGAQAYGWGMYFAGKKAIAEHYRKGLTARDFINKARDAYDEYSSPDEAVQALKSIDGLSDAQKELIDALQKDDWLGFDYPHQAISAALHQPQNFELSPETEAALEKQGNLYHVDVPDDHDLLDWDKPLSEQPEKVREAVGTILADDRIDAETRAEWQHASPAARTGKRFYNMIAGADGVHGGAKGASELLQEHGIPGLRYLDGTSRAKGEGSSNYVIWDENAIGTPEPALSRKPAADQTETPEFKKWFGDSKVVDADGKPLVVYHGTDARFDVFDPDYSEERGWFFFTGNKQHAKKYGETRDASGFGSRSADAVAMPLYLSMKNPLEVTTHNRIAATAWDKASANFDGINEIGKKAIDGGHDGVIIRSSSSKDVMYAVMRPEQIKSATGNRGTFDASNPDIRFSRKPNYTPEQREFMRKAGMSEVVDERTAIRRALDGLQGKRPHIDGDAFRQGAINQFHGLKRAVDEKGGIAPENDPHLAAEMIQTASTMEAVLRFGAPELHKGALRVNRGVPGLLDALAPVHDTMPQWLGWMVAGRAKLLQAQGRENAMSAADIQAGLSLAKGHEAAFKQAAAGYVRLKNAILDLAEHTGIIDPVARQAWDHAEYIPFYRDMDAGASGPGTRQGLANQSSGIRTLKGGEAPLKDPLGNIIANFTRLIDASMKNRAVALAVDQLGAPYFRKAALEMKAETIPLDQVKRHLLAQGVDAATIAGMPPSALRGVGRMLAVKAPEGDDIVRVMRAGKAEYYHVDDPLLLRSLTAFHEGPDHLAVKVLAWFKNLLTAGATGTPDFLIRNAIRDTGEASMTSRDRFLPLVDTVRGAIDSFRETPLAQDLMMAGAAFHGGLFHTGNNEDTAKAIRRALRQHGLTDSAVTRYVKTLINPLRLWDIYRSIAESTEMGSRVSLARLRLKAGASDVEAAHEAKDFLNFQRRGDDKFVQAFTKVIPFLNARVQGADRLYRTGTAKGRRGKVLRRLAYLATLSTLLYWWNTEHYKDAYDELPDWDKDANWHIAPGTPYHLRIPKPFELGLVGGTLPERMYGAMRYQLTGGVEGDRGKQSWDAFLRGIWNALGLNPIPQAAMPIIEDGFNKNFYFGSKIEGMGDQYKAPSDRYGPTTSRTVRAASKGMAAVVGEDYTLSPKRLEHLWTGYTAGMGQYLLDGTDWVTQKATGAPDTPAWALRDYPFVGTVARGGGPPRTTRYVDEFYDLADQARMRSNQVKDAVHTKNDARAKQLEKDWGWLIGERQASGRAKEGFMNAGVREFNKTSAKLSAISKANAVIYADTTMSGQQKRDALDANLVKRNALVRTFVRQVRARQRQAGK